MYRMRFIKIGTLPSSLLCLAVEARALDLVVFSAVHGLAEAAVGRFLLDIGATRLIAAAHRTTQTVGCLPLISWTRHAVDEAFVLEGLQAAGSLFRKCRRRNYTGVELRGGVSIAP
jgi:hypothetical protein